LRDVTIIVKKENIKKFRPEGERIERTGLTRECGQERGDLRGEGVYKTALRKRLSLGPKRRIVWGKKKARDSFS